MADHLFKNLKRATLPVLNFEKGKSAFFPNNMIIVNYWFQCKWRALSKSHCQALTYFEGNSDQRKCNYWDLCHPQVPGSPKREQNQSLNCIVLSSSSVEECTPIEAAKQPVTFKSFYHQNTLKMSDYMIIYLAFLIYL